MAFLDDEFLKLTGTVGGLSFYKMRGCKKRIVRQKWGPSAERVQTDPNYERTRENCREFGGCSTAGGWIRAAFKPQKTGTILAVTGNLNARLRSVLEADTVSPRGERHVLISKAPQMLEGFPLNDDRPFDTVVTSPIAATLSRENLSARINIPELIPGISLSLPDKLPMYCIVSTLALVPDFFYAGPKTKYQPARGYVANIRAMAATRWFPALEGSAATTLDLKVDLLEPLPDEHFSLVLAVAIHQGEVYGGMRVQQDVKAGAAKILAAI